MPNVEAALHRASSHAASQVAITDMSCRRHEAAARRRQLHPAQVLSSDPKARGEMLQDHGKSPTVFARALRTSQVSQDFCGFVMALRLPLWGAGQCSAQRHC